ncbi:MAG: TonB family protein [Alphaproteobacteria bacterium]|uniref:TonB family protein n=1 Tax=Candidatus Nitrobium versatile TaxID=2884831 RepID=A0A953M0L2_9BACT|nr:TonB family protein [Candidatus Nitrobium versatile]
MNRSFKALQLSLALHAALVIAAFAAGLFARPGRTPMVIDFTLMESPSKAEKLVRSGLIRPDREKKAGKRETKEQPEEHSPYPAPQSHAAAEARALPAPEQERIPPVSSPVPGLGGASPSAKSSTAVTGGRETASLPGRESAAGPSKGAYAERNGAGEGESMPEGMKKRYLREHFAYIRDRVIKGLSYPAVAKRKGWEGRVVLSFSVAGDGSVGTVKIVQSSGREVLDQGALEAVRRASPFPRPPVEAEVVLPVVYQLR